MKKNTEKFQAGINVCINDVVDLCNMLILEQDKCTWRTYPSSFKSTWLVAKVLNQIDPESLFARVVATSAVGFSPLIHQAFKDGTPVRQTDNLLDMRTFGGTEFVTEYCQHELKNHFFGHVCVVLDTLCHTQILIDPVPHNMANLDYGIVPDIPMVGSFDPLDGTVGVPSRNGSVLWYLVGSEYSKLPDLTDEVQEQLMALVPKVLSGLPLAKPRKKNMLVQDRALMEGYTLVGGKGVDPILMSNMIRAVLCLN